MRSSTLFHKGDRCRIKDWVNPDFYGGMTTVGNEGWVRGVGKDQWGFEAVLIEWDKNHWTYNGAPDGWTFADHFDKIASLDMDKTESQESKVRDVVAKFAAELAKLVGDGATVDDSQSAADNVVEIPDVMDSSNSTSTSKDRERDDALVHAMEDMSECESFVVIGVKRKEDSRSPHGVLIPSCVRYTQSREAEIVADAFISTLAMDAHHSLAIEALAEAYKNES